MLGNILAGLGVMALCLFLQVSLLLAVVRFYKSRHHIVSTPGIHSTARVLSAVMLILVVGNLVQVAVWAALFRLIGEFGTFGDAFYHSAVNFATLGYGDVVMTPKYRLLGPLEAINGVIMIGVSTSSLLAILQDALRKTDESRQRTRKPDA